MRSIVTTILILFLGLGCTKKSQPASENFRFDENYGLSHGLKDDVLHINVHLKNGLHVYGLGEKIGKPINLVIAPDNGWQAIDAASYPAAKSKNLGSLGLSQIIESDFQVTQKIKRGSGPGKALFFMQVCTDNACDQPRTHEIKLP